MEYQVETPTGLEVHYSPVEVENPLFLTDYYKVLHFKMYPENTTKIYSNLTPRKSRIEGIDSVVVFGIQALLNELNEQWEMGFFRQDADHVIGEYKDFIKYTLGIEMETKHLYDLHSLGYLPLHIKALDEGTLCPIGVPVLTITNTVDHAYWLVNYLETYISAQLWQSITSATIAHKFRSLLDSYAFETGGAAEFVQFQGHDFSMRGMSSMETSKKSGAGHLLSFAGTDTIPAIRYLQKHYAADIKTELVGTSVPATEHSVMCMGTKDDEVGTFARLLEDFPTGILSVVSDTWDLWKVCTEYLPELKEQILARDGKLVIRPDSGDPVDILCGISTINLMKEGGKLYIRGKYTSHKDQFGAEVWGSYEKGKEVTEAERKGVIELLWDVFGGTTNEQGYRVLDAHIGAIYGDSITLQRAEQICERLKAKGFASTNVVLGVGSFSYQYNTRDTFGFAVKATYGELTFQEFDEFGDEYNTVEPREIFKDPITDDGTKKSKKGLLSIPNTLKDGKIWVRDQVSEEDEKKGLLRTVFLDGELKNLQTLSDIRKKMKWN